MSARIEQRNNDVIDPKEEKQEILHFGEKRISNR